MKKLLKNIIAIFRSGIFVYIVLMLLLIKVIDYDMLKLKDLSRSKPGQMQYLVD